MSNHRTHIDVVVHEGVAGEEKISMKKIYSTGEGDWYGKLSKIVGILHNETEWDINCVNEKDDHKIGKIGIWFSGNINRFDYTKASGGRKISKKENWVWGSIFEILWREDFWEGIYLISKKEKREGKSGKEMRLEFITNWGMTREGIREYFNEFYKEALDDQFKNI